MGRAATSLDPHLNATLFKALCDPNRLALLSRLASCGSMSVSEASDCCGVHVSGTSRHLKMLEQAGVLRATRKGREVRYALSAAELVAALRGFADAIEACCQERACCGVDPLEETNDGA